MAKPLDQYAAKRDFSKTAEPRAEVKPASSALRFVVQKHAASRLHYDFRLEWQGVLLSWAVPRGPSTDPKNKRLAVRVEDHPVDYRDFEGTIPKGEYGGGTVMLWDEGVWQPDGEVEQMFAERALKFRLHGQRLVGKWTLIHMRPKPGEEDVNWLLIKERDEHADPDDVTRRYQTSVRSGRAMEEIAREGEAAQGG